MASRARAYGAGAAVAVAALTGAIFAIGGRRGGNGAVPSQPPAAATTEVHAERLPIRNSAVDSYLARFNAALTSPTFDSQINPLYDEGVALLKSTQDPRSSFALKRALDVLEEELDFRMTVPTWAGTSPALIKQIRLEIRENVSGDNYATALTVIEKWSKKFSEKDEIYHRLITMKGALGRAAASYGEEVKKQCDEWVAIGKKNDAVRVLEQARQKLSGFPDVLIDLDHYAQSLR